MSDLDKILCMDELASEKNFGVSEKILGQKDVFPKSTFDNIPIKFIVGKQNIDQNFLFSQMWYFSQIYLAAFTKRKIYSN